jgi:hypothetical protein
MSFVQVKVRVVNQGEELWATDATVKDGDAINVNTDKLLGELFNQRDSLYDFVQLCAGKSGADVDGTKLAAAANRVLGALYGSRNTDEGEQELPVCKCIDRTPVKPIGHFNEMDEPVLCEMTDQKIDYCKVSGFSLLYKNPPPRFELVGYVQGTESLELSVIREKGFYKECEQAIYREVGGSV